MNPDNLVVDPRFAAGRGDEFSAGRKRQREHDELQALAALDEQDLRLPLQRIEDNVDLAATDVASLESFIPEHNVGYRLLQKLGWSPGTGLGREGGGIAEPVRMDGRDNGARCGLGRAEVDKQYYAAENVQRRALETEVQAFEDEERTQKREMEAERQRGIREDVSEALATFFCVTCNKQYTTAMELEGHLSSYDHHHAKRMAETRAMLTERGRRDRGKKERRAAEREKVRLEEQIRAARRAAGELEGAPPLPPEDDGIAPPGDEAAPLHLPPLLPVGDGAETGGGWGGAEHYSAAALAEPLALQQRADAHAGASVDAAAAEAGGGWAGLQADAPHPPLPAPEPSVPALAFSAAPVSLPGAGVRLGGGGNGKPAGSGFTSLGAKKPAPASVFGAESSDEDG